MEDQSNTLIRSYAGAETGRLSLLSLLDDISSYMVSDQVWITDLEPRADYAPVLDEGNEQVINEAFASVPFGKNVYSPKEQSSANCVAIRGFYRSDRNDVLALIAKLRSSEYFDFTWNGKDLTEGQIVKTLEAAPAEGNYAAPFELIIPLKNSISLK